MWECLCLAGVCASALCAAELSTMKPEITCRIMQRIFIWCCWKLNEDTHTIIAKLLFIFDEEMITESRVRFWLREFHAGRTRFWDLQHSGRPRSGRSDDNVEAVMGALTESRNKTVSQISLELDLKHTTVHRILRKDLLLFKKCAKFVPKILTQENKDRRVRICRYNLGRARLEGRFFHNIITGDESYIHIWDPGNKEATREWLAKDEDHAQKPLQWRGGRNSKCLLIVFFDWRGIVHHEYHRHTTINGPLYRQILECLFQSIQHRRTHQWRAGTFILHDDNARPHRSDPVLQFLHGRHARVLDHPPYSPDLAPADFFLFPRVKKELRGIRFDDLDSLEECCDDVLGRITQAEFQEAVITKWKQRMRKCVQFGGRYFEGMRNPVPRQ